jgi:7,8-dihydroneopterin 2',3'-cyclic phosphate phosphodiesterase
LQRELEQLINQIHDKGLRKKVHDLIQNPAVSLKGMKKMGLPLSRSPAGKTHHHSYPEGLVEHMIATSRVALALCDSVEKTYRGKINRDLVRAGILLHDIFKPATYVEKEDGTYGMSLLGERLDHLSILLGELYQRKMPIELLHVIAAHHGRAGPISPRTVEALIVHVADVADSTLNGEVLYAAKFILRDCTGEELEMLTSEEAFNIVFAKQTKGCEGVREELEKIKRKRCAKGKVAGAGS